MRRLAFTIFLSVLASLLLFAVVVAGVWHWSWESRAENLERELAAAVSDGALRDPASSQRELQRLLDRWHERANADLTVVDDNGRVLAQAGRPILRHGRLPGGMPPGPDGMPPHGGGPMPGMSPPGGFDAPGRQGGLFDEDLAPRRRWVATVELNASRTLYLRPGRARRSGPPVGVVSALAILVAAVALVAWPVSRRIAGRLERLQRGVEKLGAGELTARVPVEGRDEVAGLARSFNAAAGRIEELVADQARLLTSQKRLLANASHELRSPLARIRMALELLRADGGADPGALRAEVERNIGELDQLIDEILTASRLDTSPDALKIAAEPIDLVGLAAEEAARIDAETEVAVDEGAAGAPVDVHGDPTLLRRLLRNLLENARRYHPVPAPAGEPIRVMLRRRDGHVEIEVLDRGPGVPPGERERIFEAFYRVEGHSERAGGVGLGLALARQIATAHGGGITCTDRPGGGGRFVVSLPRDGRQSA